MRAIPAALATVMTGTTRQPRYKVYLWDILSTGAPAVASIVASTANTTYRVDATAYVQGGVTIEEAGDKRAAQVTLKLTDLEGRFDPVSGQYATYMQRNQVVQILAGDATVSTTDYVPLFFGLAHGQCGFIIDRESLRKETSLSYYSRTATPQYLKRRFVSPSFDIAVDFGTIIDNVARNEMGLTAAESTVPTVVGQATQFTTNTIADLTPLEAIGKILEAVGRVPDFDGAGRLRSYSLDVRRAADVIYNLNRFVSIEHPASDAETYNSVKVIGLNKSIELLKQPEQALARATIPVGFWRPEHEVDVWWSDDRSLRAINTTMVIEVSVNDAILFATGSEEYEERSEYGGRIIVTLGWFMLGLAVAISVTLLIVAAIPDAVLGYVTQSIGRLIEAALLELLVYTVGQQSSGVYEIRGTPLLPVYKEISAVMTVEGTDSFLLNQKTIENDWINTQEHLLLIATIHLLWEVAQASPRRIVMLDDLALEIGDIIEYQLGSDVQRLWIASLRRTLQRGDEVPLIELEGYKIPLGGF